MHPNTLTLPPSSRPPTPDEVHEIASLLSADELVLLPTDTVYGIAARADSPVALKRLNKLKGRPSTQALSIHLGLDPDGDPTEALPGDLTFPAMTARLARDFWPGPLTLVLETQAEHLAAASRQGLVGLRAPRHSFTAALLRELDFPVVMTSANAHGQPPAVDVPSALAALDPEVLALVVDAGASSSSEASSVLALSPGRFEVAREGSISKQQLQRSAGLRIAFACTGNTCRSPMAEALGRAALTRALEAEPGDFGFQFSSFGVAAYPGGAPSAHAATCMHERGLNIAAHRSSPATAEALQNLDRIYTMTEAHRDGLLGAIAGLPAECAWPSVELLSPDGRGISDPFGGNLNDYERAAQDIEMGVGLRAEEWL